jgi:hypothetical protein
MRHEGSDFLGNQQTRRSTRLDRLVVIDKFAEQIDDATIGDDRGTIWYQRCSCIKYPR